MDADFEHFKNTLSPLNVMICSFSFACVYGTGTVFDIPFIRKADYFFLSYK